MANEAEKYRQEIDEKYQIQRESEVNEQRRNMERLRMHREQDRQKYIETKQLQQQMYKFVYHNTTSLNNYFQKKNFLAIQYFRYYVKACVS